MGRSPWTLERFVREPRYQGQASELSRVRSLWSARSACGVSRGRSRLPPPRGSPAARSAAGARLPSAAAALLAIVEIVLSEMIPALSTQKSAACDEISRPPRNSSCAACTFSGSAGWPGRDVRARTRADRGGRRAGGRGERRVLRRRQPELRGRPRVGEQPVVAVPMTRSQGVTVGTGSKRPSRDCLRPVCDRFIVKSAGRALLGGQHDVGLLAVQHVMPRVGFPPKGRIS